MSEAIAEQLLEAELSRPVPLQLFPNENILQEMSPTQSDNQQLTMPSLDHGSIRGNTEEFDSDARTYNPGGYNDPYSDGDDSLLNKA